ncbi:MAG: sulfatase [Bacteroidota bacterium]
MLPQIFRFVFYPLLLVMMFSCQGTTSTQQTQPISGPNILLAISDDQSYPHTSIYGFQSVQTPAFDRIAKEGVLFTQAFAGSPGCSPSRAALLTGRHCWQLEHAGTHASFFSPKYVSYPDLLKEAGYAVGYTGKGWGPGDWKESGRANNPAGPEWNLHTLSSEEGISNKDYSANFRSFLESRDSDQPFCFWFGAHEPHRKFGDGLGLKAGKQLSSVDVPGFLPDAEVVRSDILDYCHEIEWFDKHLGHMIHLLEEAGELDNTLILVTSDNGMAFPRAKATAYEYGVHVPLAIRWGKAVPAGRTVDDLIGFVDLAPTILEATGVAHPETHPMIGKSILSLLKSDKSGIVEPARTAVFSSRERHSSSRYHTLGYPQRVMRTHEYAYIRNFKPERWPSGAPVKYGVGNYPQKDAIQKQELGPEHGGYHDIDACPTLSYLIEQRESPDVSPYFHLSVDHRPSEELFNIQEDPFCLKNLATDPTYLSVLESLRTQLMEELTKTGDPRVNENGDIWETYPRLSRLRAFPEPAWAKEHPEGVPEQPWLEKHWAKQLGN